MRLVNFVCDGTRRFGAIADAGVVDLSLRWSSLTEALAAASLSDIEKASRDGEKVCPVSEIEFRPLVSGNEKIICVGLNFRSHADEAGLNLPEKPAIFVRFPDSVVAHEAPIVRPSVSERYDFEGEVAVVIAHRAWHVPERDALSYVAGYTGFGEHSIRDWQMHSRQATPGKNFRHSGSMGPWLVTTDELPDPSALSISTRLNGVTMQSDTLSNMIFSVAELIAYITTFTVLDPGDVVVTGTPAGVGFTRKPPVFLKPGDVVEIEVSGIGILRNTVVDEETAGATYAPTANG